MTTEELTTAPPSQPLSATQATQVRWWETVGDYISIARPDHWFKNVFMVVGIVLAFACYYETIVLTVLDFGMVVLAFFATCMVASSNYVINEILDAPTDRSHPVKCQRPIPSGRVKLPIAYAEWLVLGAIGLGMAWAVNFPFFVAAGILWIMGLIYNIPPIRSKELPYLDVISESVNNPLRLALGWFVVSAAAIPPMSLLISYWMVGAFFMATKRFSEYRSIGDPVRAAAYRSSFRYYDENRLLISMFFYANAAALFLGVFIIRYHLELLLSIPLIAGFFSYYLKVALKDDSSAQAPEKLYREKGLMSYLIVCLAAFLVLMFVKINYLYALFNVPESGLPSLWEI
jgi:decaprenyl-phosphate phosphoribosyltransferase